MYFPATLGPEAFLGTGRTMTTAFIGQKDVSFRETQRFILGQVIEYSTLGSTLESWEKNYGHFRQYLAISGLSCPIWVEHRLSKVEYCIC